MTAREKLNELKELWGLKTDEELAFRLETQKTNIDSWVKRDKVPEKWLLKIGQLSNTEYSEDMISLNFYEDIYASAGYGTENSDTRPTPMTLGRAFLEKVLGITCFKKLDIIRVSGDSMLPLIQDGEYVIVDRGAEARNRDTVVANISGELYIKRLYKEPFSEWVRLESENKEYLPIEINTPERLECLKIIGVVRSKIKLF